MGALGLLGTVLAGGALILSLFVFAMVPTSYNDLTDLPVIVGVDDFDFSGFANLTDIPSYDFSGFANDSDIPSYDFSGFANLTDIPSYDFSGFANDSDLFSGSYDDLTDKPNVALSVGLVCHYPFDLNSKDIINRFDGTDSGMIYGAVSGQGKVGLSAYFGSSAYVSIPSFGFTSTVYTVAFWIKTSAVSSGYIMDFQNGRLILAVSSGDLQFYDGSWHTFTGSNVDTNTWIHVQYEFNSSYCNLYLDGVFYSAIAEGSHKTLGGTTCFGTRYDHTGNFYTGYVDDLRFYGRLLNDDEHVALAVAGV